MMTSSEPADLRQDDWQKSRFQQVAPATLEIHRERAAKRFLVVNAGGYWPVLTLLPTGRLVIVCRTDDFHLGQRGRLAAVVSDDGGESWSYPFYIDPRGPDDRNPAVGVTPDGVLLCAFYRANCYENGVYNRTHHRPFDVVLSQSEDGGETWSGAKPIAAVAGENGGVFGRISVTPDGDLLIPHYKYYPTTPPYRETGFLQSQDKGRTWSPHRPIAEGYSEMSLLPLPDGRLLAAMRAYGEQYTALAESSDGGATWTVAEATPIWGYPPHLIRLHNGWLLVVYGKRRPPYGEYACISRDGGTTWEAEDELLVCASHDADLGYPASVQQADGSIWTVYYQKDKPDEKPCLMGTHWRVPGT